MRPFLFALLACFVATPALAGLNFCNQASSNVSVAIGYKDNDSWTSEGWWTVAPGDCTTPVAGDLKNRYYYYRLTSPDIDFPTEDYFFCTSSKAFTIVGDTDCQARGYDRHPFLELDTGQAKDWTVNITSSDDGAVNQNDLENQYEQTYRTVYSGLQGFWVDASNDAIGMLFDDHRLIDYLDNYATGGGNWNLADTCDGAAGAGPVLIVTYDDFPNEPLCWVITALNERELGFRAINGGSFRLIRQ